MLLKSVQPLRILELAHAQARTHVLTAILLNLEHIWGGFPAFLTEGVRFVIGRLFDCVEDLQVVHLLVTTRLTRFAWELPVVVRARVAPQLRHGSFLRDCKMRNEKRFIYMRDEGGFSYDRSCLRQIGVARNI